MYPGCAHGLQPTSQPSVLHPSTDPEDLGNRLTTHHHHVTFQGSDQSHIRNLIWGVGSCESQHLPALFPITLTQTPTQLLLISTKPRTRKLLSTREEPQTETARDFTTTSASCRVPGGLETVPKTLLAATMFSCRRQ